MSPAHQMEVSPARVLIRPSVDHDLKSITAIYAWHVLHGDGSFELEPPSLEDIAARRTAVLDLGLPWLVAEHGGAVAGYAYASHFRDRGAYRYCVEDSVYVAAGAAGHGLGQLLLAELIARCTDAGARQMVALIGDAGNAASIALHRGAGFAAAGVIGSGGWKHERWLDVVLMQRQLGAGAATAPLPAAA